MTTHPPTPKQQAADENTTPEKLAILASGSIELAQIIAKNPTASPKLLQELASSRDRITRQGVASNPNTPTDILFKLGAEFPAEFLDNPIFSLLMLENLNFLEKLPSATLRSLLKEESVPESFLEWVVDRNVYDDEVLRAVIMNPKSPNRVSNLASEHLFYRR